MATTGLDAFDRAIDQTNGWIQDLMYELGWESREPAYSTLRAVLHTLRDMLPQEDSRKLGSRLPILVRGLYYEDWDASSRRIESRNEALERVERSLAGDLQVDPEDAVRAVLKLMHHRETEGEIQNVGSLLPEGLAALWPRRM